jgi:hypothetical protein
VCVMVQDGNDIKAHVCHASCPLLWLQRPMRVVYQVEGNCRRRVLQKDKAEVAGRDGWVNGKCNCCGSAARKENVPPEWSFVKLMWDGSGRKAGWLF